MAKAGGGCAGAGGNGALTWVVSGAAGGGGPGRGIVPGRRWGREAVGPTGVGGGWGKEKRGKYGPRNGRPVGVPASRAPSSPPLFFLVASVEAPAAGTCCALATLGDKP